MMAALARLFAGQCPYCGSIEFRSVGARNVVERTFRWLLLPHRCSLCGHHVFRFRWQVPLMAAGR